MIRRRYCFDIVVRNKEIGPTQFSGNGPRKTHRMARSSDLAGICHQSERVRSISPLRPLDGLSEHSKGDVQGIPWPPESS